MVEDLKIPLQELGVESVSMKECNLIHAMYLRSPKYVYSVLRSGKPFIFHGVGDDIRHGLTMLQKVALLKASARIVTMKHIQKYLKGSVFVPRPVNMEKFAPRVLGKGAVYFMATTADPRLRTNELSYLSEIKKEAEKRHLELTVVKSMTEIPYSDMPKFLSRFALYFDKEYEVEYGKTALEAMAMKMPVWNRHLGLLDVGTAFDFVRLHHDSRLVARKLLEIYNSVLNKTSLSTI